jgi:hypothetical protein
MLRQLNVDTLRFVSSDLRVFLKCGLKSKTNEGGVLDQMFLFFSVLPHAVYDGWDCQSSLTHLSFTGDQSPHPIAIVNGCLMVTEAIR